jgi:sugar O-acyltransferase (sialic acid O-acetyltransferase NeuD family)
MADLVIFGASRSAEVAKAYLDAHSEHRVVGFTVDAQFATSGRFADLPLVAWEHLEQFFPPDRVQLLGPISYRRMNEFRRDRYLEGKARKYRFASFIHPDSRIYTKDIGEHCFILAANVIEPFVTIGNNVIVWGGSYLAHHCVIGDHCFLSAQVGIAGATRIGERCFLGGQVGVIEGLTIGDGCLLSGGAVVAKDLPPGSVVVRGAKDHVAPFHSARMRYLL